MSTRFLATYTLLIVAVLTFSYLQNLYSPAVLNPADDQAASAAADDESKSDADDAESNGETNEVSSDDLAAAGDGGVEGGFASDKDTEAIKKAIASELFTLGSIAADHESRFLITLDSAGANVRRVEMNFRKSKRPDQFKYRDLEFAGGYVGELDCVDSPLGCRIRCVGHGTPAFAAGFQVGDVITQIDGEPVVTADDFEEMIAGLKPGQEVAVGYRRGDSESEAKVVTTDKPMELIRPQPDILDKGWEALPSFRSTLLKPSQQEVWEPLDPSMMEANWQVESVTDSSVSFSYLLSDEKLKENGIALKGPIKYTKTYSLAPKPEGESGKDFHFLMELKIENLTDVKQEICCQLNGPLGTPTETWWYQNKIHGRNWAIGYIAGARDVVGSTAQEEFTFFGGPEIASNLTKAQPKYFWVLTPPAQGGNASQQVNYLSVDTQYFNVAMLPVANEEPFTAYSVLADAAIADIPSAVKEQKLVDCTFKMFKILELQPQEAYSQSFEIFAGPKEAPILAEYGLDEVRSFGWFAMFSKPLCALLRFFHTITFQLGYGIPIILLTVLVRSLMIPVSRKAALNAQMMQYLQPQMKEIADKHKDDMEKRGQAQRELFRKYNYNPLSGCLVGLIQIPIFIGLYRGLSVDIALRDQPLIPGLSWCSDLSAPDKLWFWKESLPGFMSFLTHETGWLGPYLNILPIITCVLFIIQQKLFTPPPTDEQQEMMQKVMKYAMVFMGVLFFKVPSGLCLYFITSSIWGIAERKMLPKPQLDTSKLENAGGQKSSVNEAKAQAKQQLEDQKRQEMVDEKKRRDKERKKKLKQR